MMTRDRVTASPDAAIRVVPVSELPGRVVIAIQLKNSSIGRVCCGSRRPPAHGLTSR